MGEGIFEQVLSAARRLEDQSNRTPVATSRTLNERVGAQVHLKCENFQRVGAFKFRGAYNAVSRLSPEDKARGVVTHSSGNHAQAVALVGRLLGVKTTIVMPHNAPKAKLQATKTYGAHIVAYDPETAVREEISQELQKKHGWTLIHPYDNDDVIAGQGTAALELFQSTGDLDALLVPCGGGGLLSGSAVTARHIQQRCRVIGIEPELADDATRSFHTGVLHTVRNPPTIADGTRTPSLGTRTFPIVRKYVDDMKTVTEEAIVEAVRFLFFRMKLVVEPSGALGVAALLSGAVKVHGRVGVILSGGNVDRETLSAILKDRNET